MLTIKLRMLLGIQISKEGMLRCGKGDFFNILGSDRLSIQSDLALIAQQAQDTLHQSRLACTIFAKETYDLATRQDQAHIGQRLLSVSFLFAVYFTYLFDLDHRIHLHSFCH